MARSCENRLRNELFKLINNSIHGKTWDNQKKPSHGKLRSSEQKCKRFVEKADGMGFKIIDEKVGGVEMRK